MIFVSPSLGMTVGFRNVKPSTRATAAPRVFFARVRSVYKIPAKANST